MAFVADHNEAEERDDEWCETGKRELEDVVETKE